MAADWGILSAAPPGQPAPPGITYFLCDMRAPGIEAPRLVQIQAAHLTRSTSTRCDPADCVVGEVGDGWTVARTTLGAERMMIGSMDVADHVADLIASAQKAGRTSDHTLRQDLVDVHIRGTVLRYLGDRVLATMRAGGQVGPEASAIKLGLSTFMGRLGEVAMRVLDGDGLLEGGAQGAVGHDSYGRLQDMFLGQWSSRIGGGTSRSSATHRRAGSSLPRDPDGLSRIDRRPRAERFPFPMPSAGSPSPHRRAARRAVPPSATTTRTSCCGAGRQWATPALGPPTSLRRLLPHIGVTSGRRPGGRRVPGGPFHEWTFRPTGPTPPSLRGSPQPQGRVRSYPTAVRNGLLLFWHHPDPEVSPGWEVPQALTDEHVEVGRFTWTVRSAWQEIAENSVDMAHFRSVHGLERVSPIGEITIDGPIRTVKSVQLFNSARGTFEGTLLTSSYGPGAGVIHFDLMGRVTLVSSTTPVDLDHVEVRFTLYHSGDEIAAKIGAGFAAEVARQFDEDIPSGRTALPTDACAGAVGAPGHRVPSLGGAVLPLTVDVPVVVRRAPRSDILATYGQAGRPLRVG